ncbi:Glycosyltransferase Gtf1 [bacterium HR35]|nr:Glycosyltransferase Gtf1 [bacterium HR35]
MKLLIVFDIFSKFGGGSQLCSLRWFKNLNNLGIETYLLKNKTKEKLNIYPERIIEIPALNLSFVFKGLEIGTFLTKEAINKIKEVDLIILNEPGLISFLLSLSQETKLLNKKLAFVFHTNYDYFSKNFRLDKFDFEGYFLKIGILPSLIFRNFIIKNSQAVIFVAKSFKKLYGKKIRKKSYYLPIPVSSDFFTGFKIKEKEPNSLVYFGRLSREKRVDIIIKALRFINKKYKLFIIGEGQERDNLEELVRSLKLENQVEFLGWIENKNLPNILTEFDYFISASNFEVFSFTYLESLLRGLPPFVYDYSSSREAIPSNCGIFIKSDEPNYWAKILLQYKNKGLFIDLQKNILKAYPKFFKFHEENSSKRLKEICEDIIKK